MTGMNEMNKNELTDGLKLTEGAKLSDGDIEGSKLTEGTGLWVGLALGFSFLYFL